MLDGQRRNLSIEIAKRRRYALFGARKTCVRILPATPRGFLTGLLGRFRD
ncbi:hypothetical protein HNE05_19315 [Aquipseudomonas campi]|uniref:Uncharacterized protein n=1 Tax=Aquipseudomonas campi TaxID=2731681 RepID=A0A6M8FNN5_9GAMM|nr:hypothetical protein [Pseudomonas campi]QKE65419.1 hypothetical protein HNE05_19315 [Pseudomonas campi]